MTTMPFDQRLLRPLVALMNVVPPLLSFLLTALSGDTLTDQTGDPLRTIQDA
jgi:hypothetical protein